MYIDIATTIHSTARLKGLDPLWRQTLTACSVRAPAQASPRNLGRGYGASISVANQYEYCKKRR